MGQRSKYKCSISTLGPTKPHKIRWTKQQRQQMINYGRQRIRPQYRTREYKRLFENPFEEDEVNPDPEESEGATGSSRRDEEGTDETRKLTVKDITKIIERIHGGK